MASSFLTCKDDVEDKLLELYGEESSKLDIDDDDGSGGGGGGGCDDDDGEEQIAENSKQDDQFWESQKELVEEFLCVRSLHELSLKRHVKNAVDSAKRGSGKWCSTSCTNTTNGGGGSGSGCGHCLREIVTNHLGRCGYRASICRSEWKANKSKSILKGSHEYIEVIMEAAACRKEISYIIEVDFRSEFELAKSSSGYQQIVNQLPEVYVGKPDRLRMVLRAVCEAMKRSLAEKKMHVGPWRKFGFMQMKWLGPSVRQVPGASHMDRMKPNEVQMLNSQNYDSHEPLSRMVFFTTPLVKAMG
ncbi:hypothetical protein EJ110_NYTH20216 [Nymphaea thermarum]|nr:hypothetical protein EJ110_NYTH20216 [Nymphaea thermarum]